MLNNVFDLALVIFGFGLLIFLHELGHFLAARWAGIRVLAFALGFGPALVSYRPGLGFRKGSSEGQYHDWVNREAKGATTIEGAKERQLSPTEYRLNVLPFGGYVKMLGQEDANPAAVSNAPDSYQNCPPVKRMVVISAGVVANIITALVLFIGVFMVGLRTEPAVIGMVDPAGPAASARVLNADATGATAGLLPGDAVLSVDGDSPRHFNDLGTRVAMSDPGKPLRLTVSRDGFDQPIEYELEPKEGQFSKLREIGVSPPFTATVDPQIDQAEGWQEAFEQMGLSGVEPGMRLATLGGEPVSSRAEALEVVRRSRGQSLTAEFVSTDDRIVEAAIEPVAEFEIADANPKSDVITPTEHLLGLMPVLSVLSTTERGAQQGLLAGDVFTRLGEVEYPSPYAGVEEIKRHAGRSIEATVRRGVEGEPDALVELTISVTREGTIGFSFVPADTGSNLVALPPMRLWSLSDGEAFVPAARSLVRRPGVRITMVNGIPTQSLTDVRAALIAATADDHSSGADEKIVEVTLNPIESGQPFTVDWTLGRDELDRLHGLSYSLGRVGSIFEPERFTLKADNPIEAISYGFGETRRVAQQTYLTFLRLVQGSVRVEHLRGPVGIAHIGTMIADRGLVWLVFYMALISINLAVVNFLPLPIVDGGQFLMLLYEQFRGKPVPMALQGALTLAGLALVGAVFLVVTFNDISNLLGR